MPNQKLILPGSIKGFQDRSTIGKRKSTFSYRGHSCSPCSSNQKAGGALAPSCPPSPASLSSVILAFRCIIHTLHTLLLFLHETSLVKNQYNDIKDKIEKKNGLFFQRYLLCSVSYVITVLYILSHRCSE